jgi:hypothetical protein
MMRRRPDRGSALLLMGFLALLLYGCAGRQTHELVLTEYFLTKAGFNIWDVNMATPEREALMNSIPREKIVTFQRGGATYHVYADVAAKNLYIGDENAYQNYLSLTQGKKYCERVVAPDSSQFWSCYDAFQKAGGK